MKVVTRFSVKSSNNQVIIHGSIIGSFPNDPFFLWQPQVVFVRSWEVMGTLQLHAICLPITNTTAIKKY